MKKERPYHLVKECREFAEKHGHHGSVGGFIRDNKNRKIAFGWKEYYQKFMTKKEKMVKIENPTLYAENPAIEKLNDALVAKARKDAEVRKKTFIARNATLTIKEAPERPIYENETVTFTFTPSPFQPEPWEKRAQNVMTRLMDYFWTSPHNSYLPIMAEIYKLLQEKGK